KDVGKDCFYRSQPLCLRLVPLSSRLPRWGQATTRQESNQKIWRGWLRHAVRAPDPQTEHVSNTGTRGPGCPSWRRNIPKRNNERYRLGSEQHARKGIDADHEGGRERRSGPFV